MNLSGWQEAVTTRLFRYFQNQDWQRLTTKEPDHSMIEVAIASVEGVFDWREYLENLHKGEQKEDE